MTDNLHNYFPLVRPGQGCQLVAQLCNADSPGDRMLRDAWTVADLMEHVSEESCPNLITRNELDHGTSPGCQARRVRYLSLES